MWPKTKIFKMATGPKPGLYQNAQSASYLPPTLKYSLVNFVGHFWWFSSKSFHHNINEARFWIPLTLIVSLQECFKHFSFVIIEFVTVHFSSEWDLSDVILHCTSWQRVWTRSDIVSNMRVPFTHMKIFNIKASPWILAKVKQQIEVLIIGIF